MAIIVGAETYKRFVVDKDDLDIVFLVDGKEVSEEKLEELGLAAEKDGQKIEVDFEQRIKEGAKRIWVTFRPLRSRDKIEIENTIQMEYGGDTAALRPGDMRRLAIKRAVISWDYEDAAWSDNALDNLDAAVFESLYSWVSWGGEPAQQSEETGLPLSPAELKEAEKKTAAMEKKAAKETAGAATSE